MRSGSDVVLKPSAYHDYSPQLMAKNIDGMNRGLKYNETSFRLITNTKPLRVYLYPSSYADLIPEGTWVYDSVELRELEIDSGFRLVKSSYEKTQRPNTNVRRV